MHLKIALQNCLLLALSILVALIVAECALRAFAPQTVTTTWVIHPPDNRFDPRVGYLDYKNAEYIVKSNEFSNDIITNNEGVRDDNFSFEQPAESVRVAVLGDSFAEAIEVPKEKRFTELIGNRAKSAGFSLNIMNFGVGGFGTCQEYEMLTQTVARYKPDAVLLVFYTGNDYDDNMDGDKRRPRCVFENESMDGMMRILPPEEVAKNRTITQQIIPQSQLFSLIANNVRYSRTVYTVVKPLGLASDFTAGFSLIARERETIEQQKFDLAAKIIERMADFANNNNMTFAVVIIPHRMQAQQSTWTDIVRKYDLNESEYDLEGPDRFMREFLDSTGISYVDTFSTLYNASSEKNLYYIHNGHLNPAGHAIVADAVYPLLEENGLLIK